MRNLKPRQSSFAKFDTGNGGDSQPMDIVTASSGKVTTTRVPVQLLSCVSSESYFPPPAARVCLLMCLVIHSNVHRIAEVAALTRKPSLKRGNSSQLRRSMQARNNSYLARMPSTQETEESVTPSNEELIGKREMIHLGTAFVFL